MVNPKQLYCLALLLVLFLAGCASGNFSVVADRSKLAKTHRIVAEVQCIQADSRIRQRRFTLFPETYVTWNASFRVDRILQGNAAPGRFDLCNAVDATADNPPLVYFPFETNKIYTVGFDSVVRGRAKNFAVLGKELIWPLPEIGTKP